MLRLCRLPAMCFFSPSFCDTMLSAGGRGGDGASVVCLAASMATKVIAKVRNASLDQKVIDFQEKERQSKRQRLLDLIGNNDAALDRALATVTMERKSSQQEKLADPNRSMGRNARDISYCPLWVLQHAVANCLN